ncbi:aminotransferase class I/II-fold pyridoxal phosphate-dependent enzyme [Flavobacteriaceae bacterium]|nr:aminotransferase class I/II-fold pyridoxal phosphate-dependent enzyme [Flavobacteriaceae bacterium]
MINKKIETQAIRTQAQRSSHKEHSVPLYLSSGFVFDDAEEMRGAFADEIDRDIYSRYSNPNTSEFIEKVCLMEGAEAGFAFATGMAAIYSSLAALLNSGDHMISSRSVFGSTHGLFTKFFPKWNITCDYFDVHHPEGIEELIRPETKIIYAETPTNPGVDILDLEYLSALAKKHNCLLVIDNCFATPYLQNPIKFGADLVIHSATKLMDGQGRVLGGVTVGSEALIKEIYLFARITGPAMSPFNAWVLSKSLETLGVRADRQCENALKLAKFLEAHPKVNWVKYPFLKSHPQYEIARKQMRLGGVVVAFEVKGGVQGGRAFFDSIEMCSLSANLGDTRTIVTHPASTTHAKLAQEDKLAVGITDGSVRLAVGLEHVDDIIFDINQALDSVVV